MAHRESTWDRQPIEANPAVDDAAFARADRDVEEVASRGSPRPYRRRMFLGGLLAISLIGTCVLLTVHGVHAAKLYRWLKRAGTENSLLADSCADVASSLEGPRRRAKLRCRRANDAAAVGMASAIGRGASPTHRRAQPAATAEHRRPRAWPISCGATIGQTYSCSLSRGCCGGIRWYGGPIASLRGAGTLLRRHRHRPLQSGPPQLCCQHF